MTVRIWRALASAVVLLSSLLMMVAGAALASDDPFNDKQWGMRRVGVEKGWAAGQGAGQGEGVTIAIVDTGVDLKHPDLRNAIVGGRDVVDDDAVAMDENGHGTHVAGIAAARSNNRIGVAGVAPRARIMPIRVLDESGRGQGSDVAEGVRWAVDHGADVINLSLSGGVVVEGLSGGTLNAIVKYAWDHGAVAVIAAGNEGLFRADSSDAKRLLVTATARDDTLASYATSVGFADWGLAAPGGDSPPESGMIYSTLWQAGKSGYGWAQGTSMAAPHVAGAAAILRGLGLNAQQTVDRLLATAEDLGASGDDFNYGNGLLDVAAATKGLKAPTKPTPPRVASSPPAATAKPEPTFGAAGTVGPAPAAPTATSRGTATVTTQTPSPDPTPRVLASDELNERSALASVLVAGTLLGVAGALIGYGSFRRLRAKR